jgi:hypothetical protein
LYLPTLINLTDQKKPTPGWAVSGFDMRMHPNVSRNLARLSQLDHVHWRRVPAFLARTAFQSCPSFQIGVSRGRRTQSIGMLALD